MGAKASKPVSRFPFLEGLLLRRGPAIRSSRGPHPLDHVLRECHQPVPLERKVEIRHDGALQCGRDQRPRVDRRMIQHERSAGGQRDRERLGARLARERAVDDGEQGSIRHSRLARLVQTRGYLWRVAKRGERLRQSFQQRGVFPNEQHYHFGVFLVRHVSVNCLTRCSVTPSSSTTFVRELEPAIILTLRTGIPKVAASSSTNESLAAPSTGGAVRRTFKASPCRPTIPLFDARG